MDEAGILGGGQVRQIPSPYGVGQETGYTVPLIVTTWGREGQGSGFSIPAFQDPPWFYLLFHPCVTTPWTVAHQAPLSLEFSRQKFWNGFPFPAPGDLSDPGMECMSPALASRFFTTASHGNPMDMFLTSIYMYASTGPPYKNKQMTDKLVDAITTSTILILHFVMREDKMYDNIVEGK